MSIEITEKAILIRINKSFRENMSHDYLYESTRGIWKIGDRCENAEYAFAILNGVVLEVYKINSWHPGGTTHYKIHTKLNNVKTERKEFLGIIAEQSIRKKYVGEDVSHYFKRGASNPIKYVNC
jgi:hypothetical protein